MHSSLGDQHRSAEYGEGRQFESGRAHTFKNIKRILYSMRSLEIVALILIALFLVKLAVISRNPRAWLQFWKKRYSNTTAVTIVALVLAGIVLYFLLEELTIVQIMAVAAFMALLFLVGFLPYMKDMFTLGEQWIKQGNILQRSWLVILIGVALSLWVLWEIFFK